MIKGLRTLIGLSGLLRAGLGAAPTTGCFAAGQGQASQFSHHRFTTRIRDGVAAKVTAKLAAKVATLATTLATTLALTACGGGGGDSGGFIPTDPDGDLLSYTLELRTVDADGNPTTSASETFPATLQIIVREDNFDAAPVSGVVASVNSQFAVLSPANGQGLTNGDGIAEIEVSAGATLGADTLAVSVESPAGTVTASIGIDLVIAGQKIGFFDGTRFVEGEIGLSVDSIAFRGSSVLRVAVVDQTDTPTAVPQSIRLSSACSLSGLATFRTLDDDGPGTSTLTLETVDGLASAEYLAGSCETGDEITATLIGADARATATISIADGDADYIGFVNATPSEGEEGSDRTIIALKGTGGPGRPEVARVVFEVLERAVELGEDDPLPGTPEYLDLEARRPLAGVVVDFSLTSILGGIELNTLTGVTDSRGLVEVEVLAGNVAASTLAIATITPDAGGGQVESANSNQIVIGTGLPDQNSISMSTEVFRVPRARDIDGVDVAITVRLADKFNNPVADGTSAVFTTEYGAIDSSCLTGVSNGARYRAIRQDDPDIRPLRGTCTVLWISQAPRLPVFDRERIQTIEDDGTYDCPRFIGVSGPCPDDLGAIRGFRSTVTVTVEGEEYFVDGNGNGIYDAGEVFENLPEAFTDHNEDGVFTPFVGPNCGPPSTEANCAAAGAAEEFFDYNGDGIYSLNVDPNTGEGVYNGSLCPIEGDGVFCSRELVNVRADLVLTLSAVDGNLVAQVIDNVTNALDRVDNAIRESNNPSIVYLSDLYNNAPGAGTTITLEASGEPACVLESPETVTVSDRQSPGAFGFPVRVNGDGSADGLVTISAQAPEATAPTVIRSFRCVTFCSSREDPDPMNPGVVPPCNEFDE